MSFSRIAWTGIAVLAMGTASAAYATDDIGVADQSIAPAKSKKKSKRKADKSGFVIKLDEARAEIGPFADDGDHATDTYLHGAASAKGQSGSWEFALGARIDAYGQSGSQDFTRIRLDYTENYLRWRGDDTRITVGTQNVLWGRVDEISPIDRMSRSDLSRFILDRLPERRRAVPAVRMEHFAGEYKLDAVWLPIFDAAVMPHRNSSWNPADRNHGRLLGIGDAPAIAGAQLREVEHGSGGGGMRLTRTGDGLDYGVSIQRVRQSQPYYRMAPGMLTAVHPFSWVLGGELETQKAGATWRMEAAWNSDTPVTSSTTFQYRTERSFDLVLGTEFFPGDSETRVTLQLAGHKTFTDDPVLDKEKFYALTGEIEHPFAQGRWRASLRFIAGLDDRDLYLNPKLVYTGIDQHEIYLTAHLFSGSEQTIGGYARRDDLIMLGWQAKF